MNSDELEIRQLVSTWMDATRSGDTDTVLGLMTDDVVFLITGRPPMWGKAAFAAAMQNGADGPRPQFDGHSEIQEIQILGEWAHMWTKLRLVVTPSPGAAPITRSGYTSTLLKRQNGRWLLARDANMLS